MSSARLIEERSAILFDASRERFFAPRVNQYLRESGQSAAELLRRIRASNVEYDRFLESLLTQETSFFRYPDVFSNSRTRGSSEVQSRGMWSNPRVLRIWCAAARPAKNPIPLPSLFWRPSHFPTRGKLKFWLPTISRQALHQAERGIYSGRSLANLSPLQLETHFKKSGEAWQAKPRLRRLISFAPMNLARSVYVGRMDCIFCMNVLMYFSRERSS